MNTHKDAVKRRPQKRQPNFDIENFLRILPTGSTNNVEYASKSNIFVQGEAANAVFYTTTGRVQLAVTSEQGKAAIIGVLDGGCFFGEGCIAGHDVTGLN